MSFIQRSVIVCLALSACKGAGPTTPTPPPPAGLVINEVMSGNDSAVRDPAAGECPEFDDWVELVNDSDQVVSLAGVMLADETTAWPLPEQDLGAGEHLLIWADGQEDQGPLHASFKVAAGGETLELRRDGDVLDRVMVPALARDRSYARIRDGHPDWAQSLVATPGAPNSRTLPDDPCFAPPEGFDDHAYPCIPDEAGYLALAGSRTELKIVKFDIFDFQSSNRRIDYVDSEFYTLHDQFYLFHTFNGQPFDHLPLYPPVVGQTFNTWGELETWAQTVALTDFSDPNQARFAGDRLFSPYYYGTINGEDRDLGVGTVVHRPAVDERPAFWGFELEYADDITYDDLVVYFETLEATGPAVFSSIRWLVRSPDQEALALQMETEGLAYADRIVRYSELAVPGDVEVYNPGLTAGRVKRIRTGESGLDDAVSTDILVLDEIPDYLPPCAALITSVPQTPLSHVSLLARSRGIPNVYVAGITDDPEWDAWSRVQTRVALEASGSDSIRAGAMDFADYLRWRSLLVANTPALEPVDPTGLPWSYDLVAAPDMVSLRPLAGGKVAGMRHLLDVPGLDTPDTPLGLSIRGYHTHIDQLPWLAELMGQDPFTRPDALRERLLVLEGREVFDARYGDPADALAANTFLAAHPAGTRIGDLSRGAGIRGAVETTAMPAATQQALTEAVVGQFSAVPVNAGLRFRSSSTVEDVEGFNGAGLYVSATGYRTPLEGQRSVSEAVRRIWASYWGAEAFEERETAGLSHLDGGMGVLVHPRFADAYELSNAVLTASLLPDGSHEVLINAQEGATSVANPPTTCPPVLPETLRLRDATGVVSIERLGGSTEVAPGETVLSDAQATHLFEVSVAAVHSWLEAENALLIDAEQRSVLTLDLEAREMGTGWLGGASDRLVTKQARSLEPSVAALPTVIQQLPAPRDLLSRAAEVSEYVCSDGVLSFTIHSLRSDPLVGPDMGYSESAFLIDAELVALSPVVELTWTTGESRYWTHADWVSASQSPAGASVQLLDGGVSFVDGVAYSVDLPDGTRTGSADCIGETIWASPDAFLLDYL